MYMARLNKKVSEPSILVKPVSRFGGLDNIHVALIVLVAILVLLVVAISFTTSISIVNVTNATAQNCTYAMVNGTCVHPIHTISEAKLAAERILAGYSTSSSSASLLPYLSDVAAANVSYIAQTGQWYASIPYTSTSGNETYLLGILMQDSNLSKFTTFVQMVGINSSLSDNYVASKGTIKLYGQPSCGIGTTQAYWFIDPYAPGSIPSLVNATNLQSKFSSRLNVTVKIQYTQYSQKIANTYGLNNTLSLGRYILCGSVQENFTGFVKSLNASYYQGEYMSPQVLSGIASRSGFNMTALNSCMASSQSVMRVQAEQAAKYNVTSPSAVVVNCQYLAIPQSASQAVCYANSSLC